MPDLLAARRATASARQPARPRPRADRHRQTRVGARHRDLARPGRSCVARRGGGGGLLAQGDRGTRSAARAPADDLRVRVAAGPPHGELRGLDAACTCRGHRFTAGPGGPGRARRPVEGLLGAGVAHPRGGGTDAGVGSTSWRYGAIVGPGSGACPGGAGPGCVVVVARLPATCALSAASLAGAAGALVVLPVAGVAHGTGPAAASLRQGWRSGGAWKPFTATTCR